MFGLIQVDTFSFWDHWCFQFTVCGGGSGGKVLFHTVPRLAYWWKSSQSIPETQAGNLWCSQETEAGHVFLFQFQVCNMLWILIFKLYLDIALEKLHHESHQAVLCHKFAIQSQSWW